MFALGGSSGAPCPRGYALCGTLSLTVAELERQRAAIKRGGATRRRCEAPSYRQVQVHGSGRGLVAAVDLPEGTSVLTRRPFLTAPDAAIRHKVCYLCLAKLGPTDGQTTKGGQAFCGPKCADSAWRSFLQVEAAINPLPFTKLCSGRDDVVPLLAARHLFSMLQNPKSDGAKAFASLCRSSTGLFPTGGKPPRRWERAWDLLEQSITSAEAGDRQLPWRPKQPSVMRELFFDAIAAIHCNAFQVTYPAQVLTWGASLNPKAIAAGRVHEAVSNRIGGASYQTASLFNHSCDANVKYSFRTKDGTIEFLAKKDIQKGEALCISYADTSMAVYDRQEHLRKVYGFDCACPRCTEDLACPAWARSGTHFGQIDDPDPSYR